jgi:16S rRNA (cytosine1402-N4)-methyltransferase
VETDHIPVLLQDTLDLLAIRSAGWYIDGTLGGAGHAQAILRQSHPAGRLLGLDADPQAIARAGHRLREFGSRAVIVQTRFDHMQDVAHQIGFAPVDGILLDLGLSSDQLADATRGFSFNAKGTLDMRFDPMQGEPASVIINEWPPAELADVLYRYGEEKASRKLARAIVQARPITTAAQLGKLIEQVLGRGGRRIHPATRIFQALRIAVNDELGALERVLPQAVQLLRPGGRLAVITFHSLEDRIVKTFFKRETSDCICPAQRPVCTCGHRATLISITTNPVQPGEAEMRANPRARSAKLRVVERV